MNAKYLKTQIIDELDGAKDYIMKAIELKPMTPTWAKIFSDMSAAELEHASRLFKMFDEYYNIMSKEYTKMPKYIEDCHKEIVDIYANDYAYIKLMHESFNK